MRVYGESLQTDVCNATTHNPKNITLAHANEINLWRGPNYTFYAIPAVQECFYLWFFCKLCIVVATLIIKVISN